MTSYDFLIQEFRLPRRALLRSAVCTGLSLGMAGLTSSDDGPNSSLYSARMAAIKQAGPPGPAPGPASSFTSSGPPASQSWYEVPLPPVKEVKVHDIITIRVDTGARVSESAQVQRRRQAQYDAKLNDWIVLEGLRAIKKAPQTSGDQEVNGTLTALNRVTGQLDTAESLKFEIGATVQSVLPNGNIVLEAHRVIRTNNEQWMHSLSGVCRREDIGPNNVVFSKDIADLQIKKEEMGQIRDGYKRGWLIRWWDQFGPF